MAERDDDDAAPQVRAFWGGTITFGLVSIPVDFYAAARGRQTSMKMVDAEGHPLGRRYYCSAEGTPLSNDDIVRGYETDDGKMVVITDEEFEGAAPEESRDITLERFVPFAQISPMVFERPYWLAPAGRSGRAYSLLAMAMQRSGRAAIGRLVMRGHEYLVAIISDGGVLRAETLRHANELRTPKDLGLPKPAKPSKSAVAALSKEIAALTSPALNLHELEDREAERLHELAERKAAKRKDVIDLGGLEDEDEQPGGAEVVDLMALLRKSLGARKRAGDDGASSGEGTSRPRASASKRSGNGSGRKRTLADSTDGAAHPGGGARKRSSARTSHATKSASGARR